MGPSQIKFDQIYVLSLPAFHWFKADYPAASPRIGHSCNVVGKRQMLTFGGVDPSRGDLSDAWSFEDPFEQSLGVFDMSSMRWTEGYDPDAEAYRSPEVVQARYQQRLVNAAQPAVLFRSFKGILTASSGSYPSRWDRSGLETVMRTTSLTSPDALADGTSPAATPTATSSTGENSSKKANRTGTVLGATLGSLGAIALVVGGMLLWLRRRRRSYEEGEIKGIEEIESPHSSELEPGTMKELEPQTRAELTEILRPPQEMP